MLMLAKVRRNGTVDLLIVLAEENIERIRAYDPAEITWSQLPAEYATRKPNVIGVGFCKEAEQKEIERMSNSDPDWKVKAFKMLSRGFEYKPQAGDHDFGPTVLGKPTKGTKQ